MNPSFHELEIFSTVARYRSFRKAAEERGVSPSALSHALRALEEKLGVRLLNRTTRSVLPTEAGARLLQTLEPAFHDVSLALQDLRAMQDTPTGALRINMPRPAARLLADRMARFILQYPRVSLEVVTEERLIDIVAEGFDAGIRFGESVAADMVSVPVGASQRFAVVASPEYLSIHGVPEKPQDLMGHACIGRRFPSGRRYDWEFENAETLFTVAVSGPLVLDDDDSMIRAAILGVGCTYVYEALVQQDIRQKRLQPILQNWMPVAEPFCLYYPSRRQMPLPLRVFIDFLKGREAATPLQV
ncbi:LysR family transcriptional regulator [Gluconobacter kondonii]|uniref:LysR family transcriptional regulator n=1 Tax=Gluconobacter kondonii TaxID=941463 RepID=UPI001B8A9926|nr:LysR family transcriptional regulator [Gluconobacter kondonii]MBS1078704.1 LysR family transcriptional regulator [Gluconobacter kondonii]